MDISTIIQVCLIANTDYKNGIKKDTFLITKFYIKFSLNIIYNEGDVQVRN